jgi:hypothetical protein
MKRWRATAVVVVMMAGLGMLGSGCSTPDAGATSPLPGSAVVIAEGAATLNPPMTQVWHSAPVDVSGYTEVVLFGVQNQGCGSYDLVQQLPGGLVRMLDDRTYLAPPQSQDGFRRYTAPMTEVVVEVDSPIGGPPGQCDYRLTGRLPE